MTKSVLKDLKMPKQETATSLRETCSFIRVSAFKDFWEKLYISNIKKEKKK